jgi:hypothetical protein
VALTRLDEVERWRVDWGHLWPWLEAAPLGDAVAGLLRWAMLVLAWWLLASSLLYCLARLTKVPSLIRGAGWLTVPFVRFAVDRALVVTLAASTVVGARAGAAFASTSPAVSARAPVAAAPAPGWTDVAAPTAPVSDTPAPLPPIQEISATTASPAPPPVPQARSSALELAPATQREAQGGDNLWSIAAAHLAETSGREQSALRAGQVAPYWWSVCELNRPTLRSGHPNLIYAGEVIRLPAVLPDGDGFAPGSSTQSGRAAAAVPAAPAAAPPEPAAGPATAMPAPPSSVTRPPGSTSTVAPTTSSSSSTSTTAASAPAGSPAARAHRSPPASPGPSQPRPSTRGTDPIVSVNPWALRAAMAAALGLPVFALAGWLARLRRGRVIQASRARPGREVVRPEPDVEPLERAARAIAADQTEEWIDAALRALTAALGEADLGGVPKLRCVRAGDMGLEVLLAQPFPAAPPGWEAVDGGYVWRLEPEVGLDELVRRGSGYAVLTPAVVSLGASPEGPILADLEGFGALSVEGDADRVRAFLAGAALELTTASWSQGVELRVYGIDGFAGLDGVAVSDGAELVAEAASMARLLTPGAAAAGSMLGARAAAGADGEPWYPMVVLVGPDAHAGVVDELVAVATGTSGVAVAGVLAPVEVEWQLVVGPDGAAVLKPLDLGMRVAGVVTPAAGAADAVAVPLFEPISADEAMSMTAATNEVGGGAGQVGKSAPSEAAVGEGALAEPVAAEPAAGLVLDQGGLDEAAIGLAVGAMVAVGEEDDIAAPIPLVSPSRSRRERLRREQDYEVWVSILGRAPRITGTANQFTGRRRLTEVLVYLAVHGAERPVHGEDLRTHCWSPKLKKQAQDPTERPTLCEVSQESFHQAMSRLRATLGEGATGWHLPPAVDGAYAIGPGVGCDWTLFRALAAAGAQATARQDMARAVALYREALELVEGEPFADVPRGSFAWAESGPLVTDIRLAVARVAHELATLTRESDPNTALWATQQGLLLLPTQLCLFDAAMAASAELGDVAGLEQALAAKCWAHAQIDPDGGVPPETNELYRHLLARARETTSVRA